MADSADVIIAAVGENVMLCGENRDRQGLRLPGKQEAYVEALLATGKPVVLVVFGGRAQVISGIAERCAAVIQAWYPGEEGGHAVADILFGNVSPSAKLAVSYPAEEIYEPICYSYPLTSHSSPLTSKYPYLSNIANRLACDFYGVSETTAYELKGGDGPIMQCRHCIRYTLGYCVKHGDNHPTWQEPLSLVLGDGRRFSLQFDCKNCQMNVYAP